VRDATHCLWRKKTHNIWRGRPIQSVSVAFLIRHEENILLAVVEDICSGKIKTSDLASGSAFEPHARTLESRHHVLRVANSAMESERGVSRPRAINVVDADCEHLVVRRWPTGRPAMVGDGIGFREDDLHVMRRTRVEGQGPGQPI
jgi:hypothetical protein